MKTTLLAIFCGIAIASAQVEEVIVTKKLSFPGNQVVKLVPTTSLPTVSNVTANVVSFTYIHSKDGISNANEAKDVSITVTEVTEVKTMAGENYSYNSKKGALPYPVLMKEEEMRIAAPYIILGSKVRKEESDSAPNVGQVKIFTPINPSPNVFPEEK